MKIKIVVPGKPRAKGRVRFVRATGRAYTPGRTIAYESQVALAGQTAMRGRPPVEGPVAVQLHVCLPIAASWSVAKQMAAELGHLRPTTKPDLDNFVKVLDALNGIVWVDDCQIVNLMVFKYYDDIPRMEIVVDTITLPQ